jgi:hypothetical protein
MVKTMADAAGSARLEKSTAQAQAELRRGRLSATGWATAQTAGQLPRHWSPDHLTPPRWLMTCPNYGYNAAKARKLRQLRRSCLGAYGRSRATRRLR